MWTFVHGASALMIDGKYDLMAPGKDINAMIAATVPLLLAQPAAGIAISPWWMGAAISDGLNRGKK